MALYWSQVYLQHDSAWIPILKRALEANPANNRIRFKMAYQYDIYLRKPFEALPWYREFLKYLTPETEKLYYSALQVPYSEYAKNRIKEISGNRNK